jgi:hypothetical protein
MIFVQVQGSDAFFESKKRFVDFSSVKPSLLILITYISTSFASSKINERQFAMHFI